MTRPSPAACLTIPVVREHRSRLYQALAPLVAGSTAGTAVVFELSTDRPQPLLTASSPALLDLLLSAPAFRGLRGGLRTTPVPRPWVAGRAERSWTFEPVGPSPRELLSSPAWDVPESDALLGDTGALDFQSFWIGGRSDGRLWVGRRVRFRTRDAEELERRAPSVSTFAASEWSRASGILCRSVDGRVRPRDWVTASSRSMPRGNWLAVPPDVAVRTAEPAPLEGRVGSTDDPGHAVALGASGAGKTTFLADRAARAIRGGLPVLAIDLHGDLAPAIAARLRPADREHLVAVDASIRPVVGVAALAGPSDRSASQLVAAVKRLTPDGGDVYWGFRLERIFDAFVRLAQETGGSLGDLYALLTDADRREAARLATRSRELASFLEEIGPIVRRTPDFLWGAAARLAKVILVPELAELLAPSDGGIPVEELLEGRQSVLVRIPFSSVGPEAATFAGSLVLARTYLGLAAQRGPTTSSPPLLVVLDEVQGLSPRLVAEMLTEGRKFHLRLLVASQYPERFAPELRLAAAGVAREVVAFRVPRATAARVGEWIGLAPSEAERLLPELPVGIGLTRAPGSGELRPVVVDAGERPPDEPAWLETVERTVDTFSTPSTTGEATADEATERLLLATLAAEEEGRPVPLGRLTEAGLRLPGRAIDGAILADREGALERSGLAGVVEGFWHLTPSGERRLGLRTVTGASTESAEHRSLIYQAFRLFARRGHRLEILRQGRYDTTLPDAIYHQIPEQARRGTPKELAEAVRSVERSWAWRFFGGLDVHVEAEVSGASRSARIRHGLEKSRRQGAFALFVVGDPRKAERARRILVAEQVPRTLAQVWTLRGPRHDCSPARPREGKPGDRSAPA